MESFVRLNLGSGQDYKEGFINLDNNPACRADLRHDLEIFPYPFGDNRFTEILAIHVIEHLKDPLDFLMEIYRISQNNAALTIKCPHFSLNWIHPRHKSAISTKLFDFLSHERSEHYGQVNFKVEKIRLNWLRPTGLGKHNNFFVKLLNNIINFFANLNITLAERIWCHWVGGFEEIVFKVRVIK